MCPALARLGLPEVLRLQRPIDEANLNQIWICEDEHTRARASVWKESGAKNTPVLLLAAAT